jgi:hypothetical protein
MKIVYSVFIPISQPVDWLLLCQTDSPETTAEVVRMLLNVNKEREYKIMVSALILEQES